ncbi:MAG: type I restriction-modification system subunit M [Nitrososphaerota archaeon]
MAIEAVLPDWLKSRYDVLWERFGARSFNFDDALGILRERFGDFESRVLVVLSELRRRGWLKAGLNEADARKRVYILKSREEVLSFYFSLGGGEVTREDLERLLKRAADLIRTRVDYTFILLLLFYKAISDKWVVEYRQAYEDALADGLSEEEARLEAEKEIFHEFDLPKEYLWDEIRKNVANLHEKFSEALKTIASRNPDLKDVFENVDFMQFATSAENKEILRQLVEIFSSKNLYNVSPDILGDAYEWILKYFAPQKAKEGEVYTPREVIRLLVEILDPRSGESVYDPCCGSGGMLILSYKYVEERYGKEEADKLFLHGQEVNSKTLALAKMNIYIHGIRNVHLFLGDTLLSPKIKEDGGIKKFDIVLANPPWNQDGYDEETLKKGEFWRERFRFGFPPQQSADWAWIQHMLASAKDDGRVGLVIDNGCLFRGGKEGEIRRQVVEKDWIECVILTPEKLFYNTGAPGALIIFNKNKPAERKGKILFVNASNEYVKHPSVRRLNAFSKENIEKIVRVYREFRDLPSFARVVNISEVAANNYNLNVTLYVMPMDEDEKIDVFKEFEELKTLEKEREEIMRKLEEYIQQIKEAMK